MSFVDWPLFWARERAEADWLIDPVIARGRWHAFYAAQKTGKSLFLLWAAATLATGPEPIVVAYFDYEMSEDDVYERLVDMGFGPHVDLSRLRYMLLPPLAPLDRQDGADELLELLDAEQAKWPGHHVVVVIDTTSRAVAGDENSADTIRAFYRHAGIGVKQRGMTGIRLDHAGKDATKGQRGSSAKGDDVDVVWRVEATDDGLVLKRDAARMGWVPERVPLVRMDNPLRYEVAKSSWPVGTAELVTVLDNLGLPDDAANRAARLALIEDGVTATNEVLRAAIRYRKSRSARGSAHSDSSGLARATAHTDEPAETKDGTPLGTPRHASESEEGRVRISRYGTPSDHDPTAVLIQAFGASIEEELDPA